MSATLVPGLIAEGGGNSTGPSTSPSFWGTLLSYALTPSGVVTIGIGVAILLAIWYALDSAYTDYGPAIDAAEVGGPAAYAEERNRRKRKRGRRS